MLARGGIERDDAAAEIAALVGRGRARGFFAGGDADVEAAVVERRRPGDAGDGEVVDVGLPEQLAGRGVERVDVGCAVAEDGDVASCPTRATLIAERTPWPASKNQWMQPVAALSE